jgi:hypothetical protein
MELDPKKTAQSEPGQAWDLVWKELRRVGIVQGQPGPSEGTIHYGQNAERAIEGLQDSKLPTGDVTNIGLLLQTAIQAAELWMRQPVQPLPASPGRKKK